LRKKTKYDVQIFGDRINVGLENYHTDYSVIESELKKENIEIKTHRLITPSLEYVFMDLIKKPVNLIRD
jgi:ribosomal protein L20